MQHAHYVNFQHVIINSGLSSAGSKWKVEREVKVQLCWETKSNRNNMPKQNRMFCYQSLGCHHDKTEGNLFYDRNLMASLPRQMLRQSDDVGGSRKIIFHVTIRRKHCMEIKPILRVLRLQRSLICRKIKGINYSPS